MLPTILIRILILCCLLAPSNATAVEPLARLAAPPLGEQWFGITMGEEQRTGFARTAIGTAPGGYVVTADNSARMVVLGFSREAWATESFLVGRDLALKSFVVEQVVDGKKSLVIGKSTAKGLRITVETDGKSRDKILKARGKIYPGPLLNIYPLMQGAIPGKEYRLQTIDPEEVKLKNVTITVVGRETLPGGIQTVHLRNDLYPFVDNDIWVDRTGRTVRESVRDGLVVTAAEPEGTARQFLLAAAIAGQELVLPFATVQADKAIARPSEVRQLTVELSGGTDRLPLLADERQAAARHEEGLMVVTVKQLPLPDRQGSSGGPAPQETTGQDNDLLALKDEIVGHTTDKIAILEKLALRTSASIVDSPMDELSPLETARRKKGNTLSRVLLFAELANLAGIPTRAVSGLAYVAGRGFVYHSWAESCAGAWLPVDPESGEVPADATHIRLAEGTDPAQLAPLAETVGRLRVKVLEERY